VIGGGGIIRFIFLTQYRKRIKNVKKMTLIVWQFSFFQPGREIGLLPLHQALD
jgi:hypothetical protein